VNYEECRDGHGRPGVFRRWFHHGCASRESLNGLVEGGRIETEFVEVFGLVCHGPSALVHLGLEDHLSDGQTVPHEPHGSVTNTETDTKNRPNFSIMEGQSERQDERLVKADPSTVGRRGRANASHHFADTSRAFAHPSPSCFSMTRRATLSSSLLSTRLALRTIMASFGGGGGGTGTGTGGSGGPAPANSGWLSLRLLMLLLAMMPILLEQCERQYLVSLRRTRFNKRLRWDLLLPHWRVCFSAKRFHVAVLPSVLPYLGVSCGGAAPHRTYANYGIPCRLG